MSIQDSLLTIVLLGLAVFPASSSAASYQYIRSGNKADVQSKTVPGFALMGGGEDLDEAFKWLCGKAQGGDFLILRARGDDDYNPYVAGICKLNSVATLIIPDKSAANNPEVAKTIRTAEAIFIAGGDQARYVNFWHGTPVQDALNAHIASGKPIGGTSAGLAILGEFAYSAQGDAPDDEDLSSRLALSDPYHDRVTVRRDFLRIPILKSTITDTHFAKRDRMGRTLVFLARIMQDGWSREPRTIAVDEKSAVLLEADGKASVVGSGIAAYFIRPTEPPAVCRPKTPLTLRNVSVYRAPTGSHFDLANWQGDGGRSYLLSVETGTVCSTQPGGSIY
jgi:cyanophycinase